jgi:phosphinothricin acetyltransferase
VSAVTTPFVLRPAVDADAARLAEIWNREVLETLATTDTQPRTAGVLRAWLTERSARYPVVVAATPREVAGFAALTPYRAKPAFHHTVEDSIYVDRAWRARGVGRRLLTHLLELGTTAGHRSVLARITAVNRASRRLHESLGFRLVGIEEEVACKFGQWLDVALYQRRL